MTSRSAQARHAPSRLGIVIAGFGFAGKIHHKAYEALRDVCEVLAIVEPNAEAFNRETPVPAGVGVFPSLGEALRELGHDVVVDFCVPAKANLALVETALEHGISRFLIEKPLGWDTTSTKSLVKRLRHCTVAYLDTYASSRGVQELLKAVEAQKSAPLRIDVVFHKNRIPDASLGRGFVHDAVPNAWMIEGPHMLSISRQVGGDIARVAETRTYDMNLGGGQVLVEHGGGHAVLEHSNGAVTHLDLSLCSKRNERRIEVRLRNEVRLSVNLPPSKSSEQISMLEVVFPGGDRKTVQFDDRPMEFCVQNAIRSLTDKGVRMNNLADGLAVSDLVEKMTRKEQFWQNAPKQWKHFGPPLRPCAADIGAMSSAVADWARNNSAQSCKALLCGVTPEIVNMSWPAGTRLWAVEQSRPMIEEVWPARGSRTKLPLQANWTRLPFAPDSVDVVIGDGCFTSLEYPQVQQEFLESLHTVIRPGGLLIMRFFMQRDEPENALDVFTDLAANRIGSFHVFKWRLAMAMQASSREGVRVDRIWQAWQEAGVATPWSETAVATINTYRGSDHRLTFTNMQEIQDLLSTRFDEISRTVPGYELGERCPIMVYSPR